LEKAKQELDYSDKIIYGDLLRFYEQHWKRKPGAIQVSFWFFIGIEAGIEKQLTSRNSSAYFCQLWRVTTFDDLFFPYIVLKKNLLCNYV
jgi:hypothetical protein